MTPRIACEMACERYVVNSQVVYDRVDPTLRYLFNCCTLKTTNARNKIENRPELREI